MKFKAQMKILLALSMTFTAGPAFASDDGGDEPKCEKTCQPNYKKCQDNVKKAQGGSATLLGDMDDGKKGESEGTLDLGNMSAAECMNANKYLAAAEPFCKCAVDNCTDEDLKKLKTDKETLKSILDQTKEASSGSASCGDAGKKIAENTKSSGDGKGKGKGGGMDPMMAGLLGAGAGALLMYMMTKKKDNKETTEDAVTEDGTIDCSKPDGYTYADCDDYLAQTCAAELNSGAEASEACKNFSGRYCNMNGQGITADSPTTIESGDASVGVTLGGNGAGIASSYCKVAVAKDFCEKQTAEVKPSCPSCIMLENAKTAACAANPTLCLPQHSLSDIAQAQVTCKGDPAFSDPTYAAGGGAAVPTQLAADGLPAVVLPTGTADTSTTTNTDTTTTDGSAPPVVLPASAASGIATASAAGGAAREGFSTASASAVTGAAAGSAGQAGAVAGFRDRVAGNSGTSMLPASSAGRSPASDVGQEYGSNLFKISAEAISNSCAAMPSHCGHN